MQQRFVDAQGLPGPCESIRILYPFLHRKKKGGITGIIRIFWVQKKIPHRLVRDFEDNTVRSLITTVISGGEKKVEISEPLTPSLMAEVGLL